MKEDFPIQLNLNLSSKVNEEILSKWRIFLQGVYVVIIPNSEDLPQCRSYLSINNLGYQREDMGKIYIDFSKFIVFVNKNKFNLKDDLKSLSILFDNYDNKRKDLIVSFENNRYNLNWQKDITYYNETITCNGLLAFLSLNLFFSADNITWEAIKKEIYITPNIGRATMSIDGYIEIASIQPSIIENLELKTLFKINKNTYGTVFSELEKLIELGIQFDTNSIEQIKKVNNDRYSKFIIFNKNKDLINKHRFVGNILENEEKALVLCNNYNYIGWRFFQKNNNLPLFILTIDNEIDISKFDFDKVIFDLDYEDLPKASSLKIFDSIYNISKIVLIDKIDYSKKEILDLLNNIKPSEFAKSDDIYIKYPNYPERYSENHILYYEIFNNFEKIKHDIDLDIIDINKNIYNDKFSEQNNYLEQKLSILLEKTLKYKDDFPDSNILVLSSYDLYNNKIIDVIKTKITKIEFDNFDFVNEKNINKVYILDLPKFNTKQFMNKLKNKDLSFIFTNCIKERNLISNFFNNIKSNK